MGWDVRGGSCDGWRKKRLAWAAGLQVPKSLEVPLFILPAGIFSGAPLSWADIFLKNLIPVTIGNALAGAFVAAPQQCGATECVGGGMSFAFGKLGKKEAKKVVEKKEAEE
ncbi:hypothetical protein AK812_SmicGene10221 [Symbiodinium microadriaticum]|uniref:Uncharacterized protein n=1 Tax=Symbiodinium microadriaticum TaxID=2951 RepID=A0A1Q9EGH8_SYMMI|nr:hypothetical protein AK812_SmicGene10221 [Symbiodinium microadriaticum]